MDDITIRQAAVADLLKGDDRHLNEVFEHYSYIAEQSARYVFATRGVSSIPVEDLVQQANLHLLHLLQRRLLGSERMTLADVNHREGYDPCLGLRPYLITSIRGHLRDFITQGGLIRVDKNIFRKDRIEKYGEKKPPTVTSDVGFVDGEEFKKPGAVPTYNQTPDEQVIAEECEERLRLTYTERRILNMRIKGYTLDEIGQALGRDKSVISRKLKRIGEKWQNANS